MKITGTAAWANVLVAGGQVAREFGLGNFEVLLRREEKREEAEGVWQRKPRKCALLPCPPLARWVLGFTRLLLRAVGALGAGGC